MIVILVLVFPRITLLLIFLMSNYLERAYQGLLIPMLGFVLLPVTTLVYAWLMNSQMPMQGFNIFLLVIAVLIDAGGFGSGAYHRSRRE
ncbi:MAG: hypothetical protein JNL62_11005 [Bryobacterales bacterium]|nr:hypothetical protein [Bryobacterales bacterium]